MRWHKYQKKPSVVPGFHGTTKTIAESVLCDSGALEISNNDYNWLGKGIYFWEGDPSRAMLWAENKCARRVPVEQPAVVGAIIDLGNCLTLPIRVVYDSLEEKGISAVIHPYTNLPWSRYWIRCSPAGPGCTQSTWPAPLV